MPIDRTTRINGLKSRVAFMTAEAEAVRALLTKSTSARLRARAHARLLMLATEVNRIQQMLEEMEA